MKKLVVFLFRYHRGHKRTKDIALLQTFGNILTFFIFPIIILFNKLRLNRWLDIFENLSHHNKALEYVYGVSFILILYFIFKRIYQEKKLIRLYNTYNYPKYYLWYLRGIYFLNLLIFVTLTFLK
jgi:hypothetical protein